MQLRGQDLQLGLRLAQSLAQSLTQPEQSVAALQGLPSSLPGLCFCLELSKTPGESR